MMENKQQKDIEWKVARQNLNEALEKFPTARLDVIDSAYLAGIEAQQKSFQERLESAIPSSKIIIDTTLYSQGREDGFNECRQIIINSLIAEGLLDKK